MSSDFSFPADDGTPRLSPSIATILATQSPAHAWEAHSKLNPDYAPEPEEKFDLGNVVHSILLRGEDKVAIVDRDSWRTNDAKAEREAAREAGLIPLLTKDHEAVLRMCDAVGRQLELHRAAPPLFEDGQAEVTLVWEEQGVACKGRLDWLRFDLATIDDVKTRGQAGGASRGSWERALYDHGAHVQAAAYLRAVETLTGYRPTWRWLVVESKPPYALNVVTPATDVLVMGEAEWDRALALWQRCLEADEWPGYSRDVETVELPHWIESRFMERQAREELAA